MRNQQDAFVDVPMLPTHRTFFQISSEDSTSVYILIPQPKLGSMSVLQEHGSSSCSSQESKDFVSPYLHLRQMR